MLSAAQTLHYTRARARSQARSPEQPVLVPASDPPTLYSYELDLAAAPHDLHLICCSTYHNAQQEAAFLENDMNPGFQAAVFLYPPGCPRPWPSAAPVRCR